MFIAVLWWTGKSGPTAGQEIGPSNQTLVQSSKNPTSSNSSETVQGVERWRTLMPPTPTAGADSPMAPWRPTPFVRSGTVELRTDVQASDDESSKFYIHLAAGDRLTGMTYVGEPLPNENYEIEMEAARRSGSDFLCGLTFPVGDESCSFIAGGWGDTVVGLSSINGSDASENETMVTRSFDNDRWYRFRVRVLPEVIQAWIDQEKVVDHRREGNSYEVRLDIEDTRPLGICAYESAVDIRNVRWRPVHVLTSSVAAEFDDSNRKSVGEDH